jgi:hypothetical protein
VSELEYYNIDVDMDKIVKKMEVEDVTLARNCIFEQIGETVKSSFRFQDSAKHSVIQHRFAEIALFCCKGVFREGKISDEGWTIYAGDERCTENGGKECYANVMALRKDTTEEHVLMDHVNHFLNDHGLELWKTDAFTRPPYPSCMYFFIKEADQH